MHLKKLYTKMLKRTKELFSGKNELEYCYVEPSEYSNHLNVSNIFLNTGYTNKHIFIQINLYNI